MASDWGRGVPKRERPRTYLRALACPRGAPNRSRG
jgi:hypothetical protein